MDRRDDRSDVRETRKFRSTSSASARYRADVYQDDLAAPHRFAHETRNVRSAADLLALPLAASGGALVKLTPYPESKGAPNWKLAWSDEFDTLDRIEVDAAPDVTNRRTIRSRRILPEQVTVRDGKLVIRVGEQAGGKTAVPLGPGRSASERQRLGRWEVRAKLPGTRGMWPAIWLLPDGPWPSEGEIDIMENRGNQPTLTSSAFHWGTHTPYTHDYHAAEQQMSIDGKLVSIFPTAFTLTRSSGARIKFASSSTTYTTRHSTTTKCGDFFPKLHAPMRLVINTAIGGDFLPPPDETTVWPQEFLDRLGSRL